VAQKSKLLYCVNSLLFLSHPVYISHTWKVQYASHLEWAQLANQNAHCRHNLVGRRFQQVFFLKHQVSATTDVQGCIRSL